MFNVTISFTQKERPQKALRGVSGFRVENVREELMRENAIAGLQKMDENDRRITALANARILANERTI